MSDVQYRVNVDIQGTATLVIDADDEEDACERAEELLNDASLPNIKIEGHKVTIEVGEADAQQATAE